MTAWATFPICCHVNIWDILFVSDSVTVTEGSHYVALSCRYYMILHTSTTWLHVTDWLLTPDKAETDICSTHERHAILSIWAFYRNKSMYHCTTLYNIITFISNTVRSPNNMVRNINLFRTQIILWIHMRQPPVHKETYGQYVAGSKIR